MVGIIKRSTSNFALGIPYFDTPGWGAAFERNFDIIDAVLSTAGVVSNIVGEWANSTVYGLDDRVVDNTDNTVWQCYVAHTSAASGTFAADRAANPTYWQIVTTQVAVREEFVTATDYFVGDFVYDTTEKLGGIVQTAFTGGASLRDNIADIGIIFDLKADLAAIPQIQSDIEDLQDGTHLESLPDKVTPIDADEFSFWDSVTSGLAKFSFANMKSVLATYFSTLFVQYNTSTSLTSAQKGQARGNIDANVLDGLRNKLINPVWEIGQRASSGTIAAGNSGFVGDRWQIYNSTNQTLTWSLASGLSSGGELPRGVRTYLSMSFGVAPSSGAVSIYQRVENVVTLEGGVVTSTIYTSFSASVDCYFNLSQQFGSGGSTEVSQQGATFASGSGLFERHDQLFTLASTDGKTFGTGHNLVYSFVFMPRSIANFAVSAASLVEGDATAEDDPLALRHIQQEVALCQRYFEKSYNIDVAPGSISNAGSLWYFCNTDSASSIGGPVVYAVEKRAVPTMTYYNRQSGAVGNWSVNASGVSTTGSVSSGGIGGGTKGCLLYVSSAVAVWTPAQISGHWTAECEL